MTTINDNMQKRLATALKQAGGTHTLQDVLDAIKAGEMQSFVSGYSWAVTSVLDTPRRRVLEIFLAVGTLADMPELERQVTEFAKEHGVTLIRAFGRRGWLKADHSKGRSGWKSRQIVFTKEL